MKRDNYRVVKFAGWLILTCFAVAGAWYTWSAGRRTSAIAEAARQTQCAHWCARRCCELLGAPVELNTIARMMPQSPRGHSLLAIANLLRDIGLEIEGRAETVESLSAAHMPCIAHLSNPDHFVVVVARTAKRVHLFDGEGRRTSRLVSEFARQWTGHILCVRRRGDVVPLPSFAQASREPSPRIQFETLFVDAGELVPTTEPVRFVYPFRNLGRKDLKIIEIHKTCSCVESIAPQGDIPPGAAAEIGLAYNSGLKEGPFFQEVIVETNDASYPLIRLKAAGYINVGVRARPSRLAFRTLAGGQRATAKCFVRYTGEWEEFAVTHVACDITGATVQCFAWTDPRFASHVCALPRAGFQTEPGIYLIELTLPDDMTRHQRKIRGSVVVETNIDGFERVTVPVEGEVAAPVAPYPSLISFGEVASDLVIPRSLALVASDDRPFHVLGIEAVSQDAVRANVETTKPNAKEIRLSLSGDTAVRLAGDQLSIHVKMTDTQEEYRIPVSVFAVDRRAARDTTAAQSGGY